MIPASTNQLIASRSGGYQIQRSLRLRASATAYLSRTFGAPTNNIKWTWSGWVKRGALGTYQNIIYAEETGAPTYKTQVYLDTSDKLNFVSADGGAAALALATNQVFRDPSAHFHLLVVLDGSNATASDRAQIWVNGVRVTSFATATYPSSGYGGRWNKAALVGWIGKSSAVEYFDGYLSEVNFIDGQALTPSSFGQTDPATGQWTAKKYTGTYGTNGFYLPFTDNSALTTASNVGLGRDYSGNGNYWVTNNVSVTAGATYDSMTDVPLAYGTTDRGNFATLNPINQAGTATPSNGNLTLSQAADGAQVSSTIGMSSGKWYYEHTITAVGGQQSVGIGLASVSGNPVGQPAGQYGYYFDGRSALQGVFAAYGAAYTTGDVIGVAYDAGAGSLTFYKNGTSQGVAATGITGTLFALANTRSTGGQNTSDLNFGQRPFTYTPPTGFKALHTGNLPAATIQKPNRNFDVVTYAATSATQTITTAGPLQPDLVWTKMRGAASQSHALYDSIRGTGPFLSSDSTGAETSVNSSMTSFNSNGITLNGNGASNLSPYTYAAWLWKAGGAAVSNNAGSISSQVSANPSAGFSIVTYTGTGANATVGHGLGVAPKMVIVKARGTPNGIARNWVVWHSALSSLEYMFLNTTDAKSSASGATYWNSTIPTSTVFSLGTENAVNNITGGASTYVAYCFAEIAGYSRFGSYTGNGSADGPFVYCGFRPRYLLTKRTDTGGAGNDWFIHDTARDTANSSTQELFADLSSAESSWPAGQGYDILSNGFKLRNLSPAHNASGGTYIFMAIAEAPFQSSLAR